MPEQTPARKGGAVLIVSHVFFLDIFITDPVSESEPPTLKIDIDECQVKMSGVSFLRRQLSRALL